MLQHSGCSLVKRTDTTEARKNQLRQNFLALADKIAACLHGSGHWADVFDPKTGLPIYSKPGILELDDVAVVCACLGYDTVQVEGCSVIVHPTWGTAVYPSVVVASADPERVQRVVNSLMVGGWVENISLRRERSEYHHSFKGCGSLIQ